MKFLSNNRVAMLPVENSQETPEIQTERSTNTLYASVRGI